MANLALIKYREGRGSTKKPTSLESSGLKLTKDAKLKEILDILQKSKKNHARLMADVKKFCDPSPNRKKGLIAKTLNYIVPKSFYSVFPESIIKLMAEESDVLEFIEMKLRESANNAQEAMRDLADCALLENEVLKTLEGDLKAAREENWDAEKLQKYIAERAEIKIYEEVSKLLSDEFDALSSEEKELRKADLLDQLEANIVLGGTLKEALNKVCSAHLQVFHQIVIQYANYMHIYKPIAVIRDAAGTMADTNAAMYAAKEALVLTFLNSLKTIEASIEATGMVRKYSVVGPDMKNMLEEGIIRIEGKVKALEELKANNQSALPPAESAMEQEQYPF